MRVGFIGIGQMGKGQALNLVKAGFELTVHDIAESAVRVLVKAGAKSAHSAKEVAQMSEVVFTCLPTVEAMEEVILGENGILAGAKEGDILIDTGTTDLKFIKKFVAAATAKGVKMLDAPVAGGVTGSNAGTLTVMVGGDKEAFRQSLNILNAIGKHVFHVGDSGTGLIVKLVNNCIGIANVALFSEALVLGVKAGIDAKMLCEIIKTGSGNSWQFENKTPRILKRDFEPTAGFREAYKDLLLVMSLARQVKAPLMVASTAIQVYEAARAEGLDDQDFIGVIRVLERISGVEVKEQTH